MSTRTRRDRALLIPIHKYSSGLTWRITCDNSTSSFRQMRQIRTDDACGARIVDHDQAVTDTRARVIELPVLTGRLMMRRNALAAVFCCALMAAGATPAGALSTQSCITAAQCSSGQVCEDGARGVPACGSNSDCGVGQICSGGACVAAPTASSVASCHVTPGTAPVEAGSTVSAKSLPLDPAGRRLPLPGFTLTSKG